MFENNYIEEFLEKYKRIQVDFLKFIESEEDVEDSFNSLKELIEESKIRDCQHDLKLFLLFLIKVTNNHHSGQNFFQKIEQILQNLKNDIQKFTNRELFNIFESNKRILLFLIQNKILIVDEYFVKRITNIELLNKIEIIL